MMHWVRNHSWTAIISFVMSVVLLVTCYQAYVYTTHRDTQAVIQEFSKQQCDQTVFFYLLINHLLVDTTPHFASPAGKPIVKGARRKFIQKVYSLERKSVPKYRQQGCDLRPALPAP